MEWSRRSPSKRTHQRAGGTTSSRPVADPDGGAAGTRLLKVGFGLYLDTGADADEATAGRGLSTEGHPIFEYLFPKPVQDS